jgi:DNA-binding NtrC family response regulator
MGEVLELLMSTEPEVIVLDLNFSPSGLDVLPIARMAHPRTPVITMADLKLHDVAIRSVKAGAAAYILKPLDRDRLCGLLQTLSRTASDHRPSHVLERRTGSLG